MDDEFFFGSTFADGTKSICREYLQSTGAAKFVGASYTEGDNASINITDGGIYVGGVEKTDLVAGQAVGTPFRVIYESDEIHPLNHFSTESASYVVNFFYNAFGTPNGFEYIAETNQTWWVKEAFSTLGLVAFFALVLPLADLVLSIPFFASLRRKEEDAVAAKELLPSLTGVRKHVSYWVAGVATTLFSGFALQWIMGDGWLNKLTKLFYTQGTLYPQDTTGDVATWAIVCGLFALLLTGLVWLVNHIINRVKYGADAANYDEKPLAAAKIGGFCNFFKTLAVALLVVAGMYLVVFTNWAVWKVDFRIWTLDVKPFEITTMLPTMFRYSLGFGIFYVINSVLNQNYKVKNLPEWATIAINAAFNFVGILLVILIQYGTFRSTGVLWQGDMALSYIVVFPIIPILAFATIISRRLYERTGNAWLGGLVNTILFTVMTVANTAASYPYVGFFGN